MQAKKRASAVEIASEDDVRFAELPWLSAWHQECALNSIMHGMMAQRGRSHSKEMAMR
jgi:hypothetical protein